MAPLYHRYIPPNTATSTLSAATPVSSAPHQQPVDQAPTKKRKRVHDRVENVPKAIDLSLRPIETSDNTIRVSGEVEKRHEQTQRDGDFAHIRSTKKRHKLEKEARKARKEAERAKKGNTVGDQHTSEHPSRTHVQLAEDVPSTGRSSSSDVDQASDQQVPNKGDIPEEVDSAHHETVVDTARDPSPARSKKYQNVLNKFERSQKLSKTESKHADPPKDAIRDPQQGAGPLKPFTLEVDEADGEGSKSRSISALPPWLAAPTIITESKLSPFAELSLAPTILQKLEGMGFHEALPVQRAIIPLLLPPGMPGAQFRPGTQSILPDVAVSAPTGSGKTLAYLLPMIETLKSYSPAQRCLRSLVVVPTRELVSQVAKVATDLIKGSDLTVGTASSASKFKDEQQRLIATEHVYAPEAFREATNVMQSMTFPPNEDSLRFDEWLVQMDNLTKPRIEQLEETVKGLADHIPVRTSAVDILVCTPGRLQDHVKTTTGFSLSHVSWLVIDEADKLLDEQYGDFLDQLQHELSRPRKLDEQDAREKYLRQHNMWDDEKERAVRKVILSATMTRDVSQLAVLQLQRPRLIVLEQGEAPRQRADSHQDETPAKHDGHYQLPGTLEEFCVPAGDGNEKPLHLLRLLETRVLQQAPIKAAQGIDDSSSDDASDSSSVSSDVSTESAYSSADDAMSTASNTTDSSSQDDAMHPERKMRLVQQIRTPRIRNTSTPTVLIFTASNEAAMRLLHLLKHLRPDLAHSITGLTKSTASSDIHISVSEAEPCIVIATDRAGRGLDTLGRRNITHVIQYDVPRSVVSYVHRVGRTARAGRVGQAWTLYTNTEARWFIKEVSKSEAIRRPEAVEKVRLDVADDNLRSRYERILAGMKESITADSRAGAA